MKKWEKIISITMLIFAVGFNLWLYRLEPTAKIDPNDNAFQYALIDRENTIWDFAAKKCSWDVLCRFSYLADHWVPNWNEGYNLPYYYSHLPQIAIVGSYRLLNFLSQFTIFNFQFLMKILNFKFQISLFEYYHYVIYFLLALFPLSVFWALRIMKFPGLSAGLGALLASQISTDGLYGLDPPSFLWRGYGLSSQLFAMIFLPQAIAYSYKWFNEMRAVSLQNFVRLRSGLEKLPLKTDQNFRGRTQHANSAFWPAVFFLFATTAGHLGIGIIAILSLIPLTLSPLLLFLLQGPSSIVKLFYCLIVRKSDEILQQFNNLTIQQFTKLALLACTTIFFLSYWIIPILLNGNYHNISYWDPVWKFNSYGAKEVMTRLINGDLFDFGRLPIFTLLTILGFFIALGFKKFSAKNQLNKEENYFPLALLFIFWVLFYFGRTTWDGLIDLIPGMKDFHLSRFIVGVHLTGLFLAPLGFVWLIEKVSLLSSRFLKFNQAFIRFSSYLIIGLLILFPIYRQTVKYNDLNNQLIRQANADFDKLWPDVDALFKKLATLPPGRIFAGRGGSWGKSFRIAETPMYMQLSTYGFSTVLWLPETWSPNADVEQFFSEDKPENYNLFNIKYVVAPPNQKPETFWELLAENPFWKLYDVKTSGYITPGILPAVVSVSMKTYVNVVHEWVQSEAPAQSLFPQLTFDKNYPKTTGLPNFRMIDEANYRIPDGSIHNIFHEPPVYLAPKESESCRKMAITDQSEDTDMIFKASVTKKDTVPCLIVLKQSFHPDWQVTLNGQKKETLDVFPSFVATEISKPGTYEIIFSYEPSRLKVILIILELLALLFIVFNLLKRQLGNLKNI